jgi:hypothetical protein
MKLTAALFLTLVSFVCLCHGQLISDYGTRITDDVRRFEAAQILVFGQWKNDEQKDFLLRLVSDPQLMKYSASEADRLFGKDARLFYSTGKRDITNFRIVWRLESRADKVRTFDSLSRDAKAEVRLADLAYCLATEKYLPQQIDFILEFAVALPTATDKQLLEFEAKSLIMFPDRDAWVKLFGATVGPYVPHPCTKTTSGSFVGDCPCNIGSSFNESCYSECADPNGSCNTTASGCGFVGYFACNGGCRTTPGGNLADPAKPKERQ